MAIVAMDVATDIAGQVLEPDDDLKTIECPCRWLQAAQGIAMVMAAASR